MVGVTLSAATRANLLSLQGAAASQAITQSRLATGRAVNSTLDNPVNYFTASSLAARSSDLSTLLDGISGGIQTTKAALAGIDSMRSLLNLAKSMVDRAARAPGAVQTVASVSSAAPNYTQADVVGAQKASAQSGSLSANMGMHGAITTTSLDLSAGSVQAGDTFQVTQGAVSKNYTYQPSGSSSATVFTSAADLHNKIIADFPNVTVSSVNANTFDVSSEDNPVLSVGRNLGAGGAVISPRTTAASVFQYTVDGSAARSFTFHKPASPGTDAANGFFQDRYTLAAAINADPDPSALRANTTGISGLSLVAADEDDYFDVLTSGTSTSGAGNMGFLTDEYRATPSLDDTQVTYSIGKGTETKSVTVSYGYGSGETTTLQQLNAQLATADMVAVIDPAPVGKVVVKPKPGREADRIELSTPSTWVAPNSRVQNGVTTLTGKTPGQFAAAPILLEPGASTRRQFAQDYNALRSQISSVARDASYNGTNLLMGGDVKFQFNETGTSTYTIQGSLLDADSLGLTTSLDGDFLDSQSIDLAFAQIAQAASTLESVASRYTTGISTATIRDDHTKSLMNILTTGADHLTLADMNEEAANATALNLRQQLGTSALSLTNQAQQGILQLLRT